MTWQLAEAKNRFSEVVNLAFLEGPQEISRRNEKVVLMTEQDYLVLKNTQLDFKQFLLQKTPDLTSLDLKRDSSPMRKVKL